MTGYMGLPHCTNWPAPPVPVSIYCKTVEKNLPSTTQTLYSNVDQGTTINQSNFQILSDLHNLGFTLHLTPVLQSSR